MQIDRTPQSDSSPALNTEIDPEDEDQRTLFCANLSENVTDDVLYELFIQSGPVESVRIPKDKDNRPRGFGFVTFVHSVTVPYAIELYSGVRLFNRDLILRFRNANNSGSRNQTPNSRPRDDNSGNYRSRDDTPRARPRNDDGLDRWSHQRRSSPDNNSLRSGHSGGRGSNRNDSNMRPNQSSGNADRPTNLQNPFNINDLTQLGSQFMFKPFVDAMASLIDNNMNGPKSRNDIDDLTSPKHGSRSNRLHNQNNPYFNKRTQQNNSSRGNNNNSDHNRGRHDSDRRQNNRRRR